MAVFTYEDENTSTVPPARLFTTLVKHSDTLLPALIPSFKSIQVVEGTGGPGTLKKITSVDEGGNSRVGMQRVDALDEASCVYHYSFVGGDMLPDTVEKVSYENQVVEGSGGGSVVKVVVKYHMKGDAPPSEEVLKAAKDHWKHTFKALEGYLVATSTNFKFN